MVNPRLRLCEVIRDEHTLAGGQTISLDHVGAIRTASEVELGGFGIGERLSSGRGDSRFLHDLLGEPLR